MSQLDDRGSLVRATATITVGNVASRITGFGRVLAVGAALGTTFLGNTYQTSNLVSNVLFELLAAGVLSSVLVPTFVELIDKGDEADAARVAGALLGLALAVLGSVTLVGMLAGHWVMRLLTVTVDNPEVRRQEIRLGAFFLWFFLPQLVLYACGAVATALLHGARRFSVPAFAPVANNVVVMATMATFAAMHGSGRPGLDLTTSEKAVLAIGTTLGVVVMTAGPVIAAWRAGLRLRPRWDPRHPAVRGLGPRAAWAGGYLALNQVVIALTLILANRVEGGVVAYQIAFTFFLLPHAVLANPVFTAIYPQLTTDALAERWQAFATRLRKGLITIAVVAVPASVLLIALARPMLRMLAFGSFNSQSAGFVSRVLVAYAFGLVGYSAFQLLTRAAYALDEVALPTWVNAGVTLIALVLMSVGFTTASGQDRVVALGVAHSVAVLLGAGALLAAVSRRLARHTAVVQG